MCGASPPLLSSFRSVATLNNQVARQVLHILSSHYPETLSSSIFQDMPWIVRTFVNLMWPFVDPATKKKVTFGSSADKSVVGRGEVEADQLIVECGGDLVVR